MGSGISFFTSSLEVWGLDPWLFYGTASDSLHPPFPPCCMASGMWCSMEFELPRRNLPEEREGEKTATAPSQPAGNFPLLSCLSSSLFLFDICIGVCIGRINSTPGWAREFCNAAWFEQNGNKWCFLIHLEINRREIVVFLSISNFLILKRRIYWLFLKVF